MVIAQILVSDHRIQDDCSTINDSAVLFEVAPPNIWSVMKRAVVLSALAGFLMPVFWIAAAFLLFSLPEGTASKVFWLAVYSTCPFWLLKGPQGAFLMYFLNALLYGLIGATVYALRTRAT